MKLSYKHIAVFILTAAFLQSCKKDTTANISKVFSVPSIVLNGDAAVSVPVGGTYTDAGAKYNTEEGTVEDIQPTSNDIDFTTPGLYHVTFSKESASGIYQTEVSRVVAVTSVSDPVDYSGTYLRAATGINCFVTKAGNGLYHVQNPGGAGVGLDVVVYFVETAVGVFICPEQETTAGPFAVNNISFSATGSSWAVVNAGYGTQQRFFDKQ